MSVKWDYDATAALLRFGRKNSGPWEDGNIPDDGDTDMVISAPEMYGAMKEFCDRCDKGEVRSKRTYAKFIEILKKAMV